MKKSIWEDSYNKLRIELKKLRLDSELTQIQLAEKLNKNQSYVSKYEIGDRNLDFIEVIRVCRACNLKPEDFTKKINSKIADK